MNLPSIINGIATFFHIIAGLLNSILGTSKTEAEKMQLEEVEFDVSDLLEDVVDLFYPIAMKKGVDLVLDHCNGSVIRYSSMKGDRGRLKQVLCNLLSNAVKFTDEGHITIRAWVQEATLQNSIIKETNQYNSFMKTWLSSSCLFYKKLNESNGDLEKAMMNSIQHDPNSVDFVFEVDDTGKGIPRENHKSVFKNYVPVKDSAVGQVGTGLGLPIVQSLVRLMHGDIRIVEKHYGEKGTCFRFNVSLILCESDSVTNVCYTTREGVVEGGQGRRTIHATSSGSPRPEPSCVVLYIENDERRRTSQMFMESLGIKVKVVKHWKPHLYYTLKNIKQQKGSYARATRIPFRSMDGSDYLSSVFKKTNNGAAPGFILVIIDANGGPFSKLCTVVSDFKKDLSNPCKIVWLDNPLVRNIDWKKLDDDDIVISKPFHGRCLFEVIEILPEYGGHFKTSCSSSREIKCFVPQGEINEKCGDSSNNNKPLSGKKFLVVDDNALVRMIVVTTLMRLGANFDQCENGEEAVRLVGEVLNRNTPYDYILMDCQMPVMDGFEATRRIREMEKCHDGVHHIPIIALTAEIDKTMMQSGMDFHIVQPFTREKLFKAIAYIHDKKELHDALDFFEW